MPLEMQALDLLAGPLAVRDVLFTFYSRDRLMSTTARLEWLEPDRAPINLSDAIGPPRSGSLRANPDCLDRDRGVGSA